MGNTNQLNVRDSHKIIGLSFKDISALENGLDFLSADIESGLVSEIRAMEVAMYSIGYTMARYQEAQDITESFLDNPKDYRDSMNSACYQMTLAKDNLKTMLKSFGHYPLVISTANSLLSMLVYYEGYMIIPSISSTRLGQARQKNISTYFFKNPITGLVKIGRSTDVKTRKQSIQCGSGVVLDVLLIIDQDIERQLHKEFSKYRKHGEWFEDADGLIADFIKNAKKGGTDSALLQLQHCGL